MTKQPHPVRGYLYIAAAALSWGIAANLGRAAFTGRLLPQGRVLKSIDPLILSQSRTSISFLVLFAALLVSRGWANLKIPGADLRRMFILGVLGVAASNYLYYFSIQRTNVATAIILQYTAPIWVLLYTVARGIQKPSAQRISAVVLALAGITLVIGVFGSSGFRLDLLGVLAALLAALSFAFYNIGGHSILARYDRWIVLMYAICSASLFWLVVNPPWKVVAAQYSGEQWLFLFVFSVISVLVPFGLYFAGLEHLDPTKAIVVSCLEPVFSIAIAAVALGEVVRWSQSTGILLVLIAIVVVQLPDRARASEIPCEPIE